MVSPGDIVRLAEVHSCVTRNGQRMRSSDGWADYPGDICRVMSDTAWRKPGAAPWMPSSPGSTFIERFIELDRTKPVTVLAVIPDLGPHSWVWCLVVTSDARLCWLPTSLLRRINDVPNPF